MPFELVTNRKHLRHRIQVRQSTLTIDKSMAGAFIRSFCPGRSLQSNAGQQQQAVIAVSMQHEVGVSLQSKAGQQRKAGVPVSMQYERGSLLQVQDVRGVQVFQAINAALGSCHYYQMSMSCSQLSVSGTTRDVCLQLLSHKRYDSNRTEKSVYMNN